MLGDWMASRASADGPGATFTPGAVAFGAANGDLTEDADRLFWDDTNDRLGIGTDAPDEKLHVLSATTRSVMKFETSGGAEFVVGSDGGVSYVSTTDASLALNANNVACWAIESNRRLVPQDDAALLKWRAGQTATTVGGAGGADLLPLTPRGYAFVDINGTVRRIPYYDAP